MLSSLCFAVTANRRIKEMLLAQALSIPQGPQRSIIVFITYMVVVFSIIVQGLTIKKFLRKWGV